MEIRKLRAYLWLPAAGIFFLALLLITNPSRETLFWLQPVTIWLNLLLIIFFGWLSRKQILASLKQIPKGFWVGVGVVFFLGLSIRLLIPEYHHKIYYDEDIYINIAHNIANEGRACLCDYGVPGKCFSCIDNKQPMGMPSFYAVLLRVLGWLGYGGERSFFITHIIISSISIVLIFLLATALTQSPWIGLASASFLALEPTHIRWSVSVSQDSFFLTFLLLSLWAIWLASKNESWSLKFFSILLVSYTVQLRTEGLLVIPIAGLLYAIGSKNPLAQLGKAQMAIALCLMLLFITPTLLHTSINKEDSWGAPEGKKFGLVYFPKNAGDNSRFFFEPHRFPIIYTLLGIVGLISLSIKATRYAFWLLVWFGLFFLLYSVFYAGSFNFGMDIRFLLTMLAPVLIFAGAGAELIFYNTWKHFSSRIFKGNAWIFMSAALLIIGIVVFATQYNHIAEFGMEASEAKESHAFAEWFAAQSGENCLFISQVSSKFLNFNRPSIQNHLFIWGGRKEEVLEKFDCIYLSWGYWCSRSPSHRNEQCLPLLSQYKWEVAAKHVPSPHDEFVMYRMVKG